MKHIKKKAGNAIRKERLFLKNKNKDLMLLSLQKRKKKKKKKKQIRISNGFEGLGLSRKSIHMSLGVPQLEIYLLGPQTP